MEIYVSDEDPIISARNLDDIRLHKQISDTAQILSSAIFNMNGWKSNLYKPTHVHHLAVRWATRSRNNFNWLVMHGLGLCNEYKYRFAKEDKAVSVILNCAEIYRDIPVDNLSMTPFYNGTPYQNLTVIKAYRQYLSLDKWGPSFPKWTRRGQPEWFIKKAA